uniref:Uncharacterized protein n=1 Tax=Cacopsylla melanoneura TaxID=428564 RepID=A0A8D9EBB5_9HEMI
MGRERKRGKIIERGTEKANHFWVMFFKGVITQPMLESRQFLPSSIFSFPSSSLSSQCVNISADKKMREREEGKQRNTGEKGIEKDGREEEKNTLKKEDNLFLKRRILERQELKKEQEMRKREEKNTFYI